jgi:hypothetical protein
MQFDTSPGDESTDCRPGGITERDTDGKSGITSRHRILTVGEHWSVRRG